MNPDAALKALAEPNRRTILTLVAGEPRPVGDIAGHLDITPQAVSRHLKVLREAGLVDERREGTRHLFVVNPDGFARCRSSWPASGPSTWAGSAPRSPRPGGGAGSSAVTDQPAPGPFATEVDLPAPPRRSSGT